MDFVEPGINTSEGISIGEIVDQQHANSIFVVGPRNGSEGFLTSLK